MRLFQLIQLVLSIIVCIAAVTALFTLDSPAYEGAMFVAHLALASFFTMRAWEVRHTESRYSVFFSVLAGLGWCLALLRVFI